MRRILAIAAAAWLGASLAVEARALTLTLSDLSNDETSAAALDATFDVAVSGNTLTITVTNQSAYNINELFFNASTDVTSLTLTSVVGGGGITFWSLAQAGVGTGQPTHVGSFGTFDYALLDGRGGNRGIRPGATAVFTLSIAGAGPFDTNDFYERTGDGEVGAFAAARFMAGPGDDSSFGAVIPEGSSLRLFGLGLVLVVAAPALGIVRRRGAANG